MTRAAISHSTFWYILTFCLNGFKDILEVDQKIRQFRILHFTLKLLVFSYIKNFDFFDLFMLPLNHTTKQIIMIYRIIMLNYITDLNLIILNSYSNYVWLINNFL